MIAHLEAIANIDNKCIGMWGNSDPVVSLQNLQPKNGVLQQEGEDVEIRMQPKPLSFRGRRAWRIIIHAHRRGVDRDLCKVLREGYGAKSKPLGQVLEESQPRFVRIADEILDHTLAGGGHWQFF